MSATSNTADLDRLALDFLTTAVLLLDQNLTILHTNPAAENLLGIGAKQLRGGSLAPLLPDNHTAQELRQVLASGASHTHRAAKLQIPGNGAIAVDITSSAVDRGRLLLELLSVDRLLEINRKDAQLSAQAASRELVRGLAHEVKNPLGGIKGAAQLLALELPPEQREYTDLIIAESNRLGQLVDQLLGPARPLQVEPINIHQITEHVAALITAESLGSGQPGPLLSGITTPASRSCKRTTGS